MTITWAQLCGFEGTYISEALPLSLEGDGAITTITWTSIVPTGTTLSVYTSSSFNGGVTWSDWAICYNNSNIPQVNSHTNLSNCSLKLKITMTTTNEEVSPTINNIQMNFIPVIEYNNRGSVNVQPEIWITKIGNGDFSLINTSNNNETFTFTSLIDNETVYVNNERQDIVTSLVNTYRFSNFNDKYLDIPVGINVFKVSGNAKIQFRSQYKSRV